MVSTSNPGRPFGVGQEKHLLRQDPRPRKIVINRRHDVLQEQKRMWQDAKATEALQLSTRTFFLAATKTHAARPWTRKANQLNVKEHTS